MLSKRLPAKNLKEIIGKIISPMYWQKHQSHTAPTISHRPATRGVPPGNCF